jgi:hypothetical protein
MFGSVLAAGSASAAATAGHPGPAHAITPGGLMIRPAGQAGGPSARGVRHQDESTNWIRSN